MVEERLTETVTKHFDECSTLMGGLLLLVGRIEGGKVEKLGGERIGRDVQDVMKEAARLGRSDDGGDNGVVAVGAVELRKLLVCPCPLSFGFNELLELFEVEPVSLLFA